MVKSQLFTMFDGYKSHQLLMPKPPPNLFSAQPNGPPNVALMVLMFFPS
jgi:hypothetical protein